MKHIKQGHLQALCDGALSSSEQARIRAHLERCSKCARRARVLETRHARIRAHLAQLSAPDRQPVPASVAQNRFAHYHKEKKEAAMRKNPFAKRYRPAWAMASLVLVLVLTLTVPPLRALAEDFLALFRVQQITFVAFNPLNLPDEEALERAALEIERFAKQEIVFEPAGESQTVDEATARSSVAFPVRFPTTLGEAYQIDMQPGAHIALQIDLAHVQMLLDGLGYNVALPDTLDGADTSIDLAPSVTASYGACSSQAMNDCTLFIQMPSPSINAPPELDMEQLGQMYLQMLGMNAREAKRFSNNVDWTTTLVIPIPSSEASYEDVAVDGVVGTFVRARDPQNHPDYVLIWVKGDIVYALIGTGEKVDALAVAGSLQ